MAACPTYTAKLTEASQKKAKDELNELPEENRAQLKQLTDWTETHKQWLTVPADPVFLMSFLRVRKFSQLLARETLVNYLTAREKEPKYFGKVDCDDPKVMAVLKDLFLVPLPQKDKHGRQVLFLRPGRIDINSVYTANDVAKTFFLVTDWLLRYEDVHVNGVVVIVDFTGGSLKIENFMGDVRLKMGKLFTKTYPVRFRNCIIYNGGPLLKIVLGVLKLAFSEKLQKRVVVTSDMVPVYDMLGHSCLPLEYLPDDYKGPHADTCSQLVDNLIESLRKPENRTWIKELSSGRFRVDETKMPPREELFQEAFRKLDVQ